MPIVIHDKKNHEDRGSLNGVKGQRQKPQNHDTT